MLKRVVSICWAFVGPPGVEIAPAELPLAALLPFERARMDEARLNNFQAPGTRKPVRTWMSPTQSVLHGSSVPPILSCGCGCVGKAALVEAKG